MLTYHLKEQCNYPYMYVTHKKQCKCDVEKYVTSSSYFKGFKAMYQLTFSYRVM